jgi:hypothetical protein
MLGFWDKDQFSLVRCEALGIWRLSVLSEICSEVGDLVGKIQQYRMRTPSAFEIEKKMVLESLFTSPHG